MKAMVLNKIADLNKTNSPLQMVERDIPKPSAGEILIKVSRCGVCHTELDEIEGRTPPLNLPIVPGHQVVGYVEEQGNSATRFKRGDRVGVAWIFSACGKCKQCLNNNENLCSNFQATGRDADGGYAEFMVVPQEFAYNIPVSLKDSEAAPLLCAGAIGYRSLRLTNHQNGHNLGLTGFGASGHLVLKTAKHQYPDSKVFVFARNPKEREFAEKLGAYWTGNTEDTPPEKLDAVIDTTPVWKPVVEALKHLDAVGRLVINAIRKENVDINYLKNIDYPEHLWMEKEIKSVANVERRDVSKFLQIASDIPIKPQYEEYALEDANKALMEIRESKIHGAKVLKIN